MKLRPPTISVRWTTSLPPEIPFPSSSSYFRRQFKLTPSPFPLVDDRLDRRNTSCFMVKSSYNFDSTVASQTMEERDGTTVIEKPNFNDNKIAGEGTSYTLDEAISKLGFGNFQFIILAYAGLGWVAEAMEIMLLSFVGPVIQPEWGLSFGEESFISTVSFAGMLVGAYMWGIVSDNHGRKMGFLGASIITAGAGVLSAFTPNYTTLLILRFLIGVGLGCGHVYASWFLEFVPTPKRGTWMVIFATFWTIGTIFEASLAWWIMPNYGWRWLLGLSAIPSLLVLALINEVPESPRYLSMKGKLVEACHTLEKGATLNKKELPSWKLVNDQIHKDDKEVHSLTPVDLKRSSSISMLLSPKLIRTTLPLWFLYFGNTFSYYGIVLLASQLGMSQVECNVSNFQLEAIQNSSFYTNVFITSLAELPGLGLAAIILDKLGRKISMEIMFIAGFILLLPLVVHQNNITTTILLFGARMFISACFIVACIYAPEVYPTNLRARGVGIATAIGRTGGMVCPLVAVGLVNSCNQTLAVTLFDTIILLSGLSVLLLPFETNGKELIDKLE